MNENIKVEKCADKYYRLWADSSCGVLLKEPLAQKITQLFDKQVQELKEMLTAYIDEVEVSQMAYNYPDHYFETIHYFTPSSADEKQAVIDIFKCTKYPFCKNEVYKTDKKHNAHYAVLEYVNGKRGNTEDNS